MKYSAFSLLAFTLASFAEQGELGLLQKCDLPTDETVILFTAPWCSTCSEFKTQLDELAIRYHEIDVEASEKNTETFNCVGGEYYPYVVVGGEVIPFESDDLEKALAPLIQ